MDSQATLAVLRSVQADFEHGRYLAVVDAIEQLPGQGGEFGSAMSLAARAILLEREGRTAEAVPLMERALTPREARHEYEELIAAAIPTW